MYVFIISGSKIYVFGGSHLETGQDIRIVECFDTETGKWEDDFRFRKGSNTRVFFSFYLLVDL